MDEPTSWLALAGVIALYAQQGFDRWMRHKERRNGARGSRPAAGNERGAVGNGLKMLIERMDRFDKTLEELRTKINMVAEPRARYAANGWAGPAGFDFRANAPALEDLVATIQAIRDRDMRVSVMAWDRGSGGGIGDLVDDIVDAVRQLHEATAGLVETIAPAFEIDEGGFSEGDQVDLFRRLHTAAAASRAPPAAGRAHAGDPRGHRCLGVRGSSRFTAESPPACPLTHDALSEGACRAGDDAWRQHGDRALEILRPLTRIAGHSRRRYRGGPCGCDQTAHQPTHHTNTERMCY